MSIENVIIIAVMFKFPKVFGFAYFNHFLVIDLKDDTTLRPYE